MPTDIAVRADSDLTIADMARRYDVSLRTLRFYEQMGLLKPKRCGQARWYSPQDRIRLEIILTGRRLRFTLREIDAMMVSYVEQKELQPAEMTSILDAETIELQLESLLRQKAEIEATIAELKQSLAIPPPGER